MRTLCPDDIYRLRTAGDPQISPDGSRVAFVVSEAHREQDRLVSHVWVVPSDGGTPRQWTSGDQDVAPRWSPDGGRLAFLSSRAKGEPMQVHLLSLDGGESRRVSDVKGGVQDLVWSPRGDRLALVAAVAPDSPDDGPGHAPPIHIRRLHYKFDGAGFIGERRSHLFVIDVESGATSQLTSGDFSVATPAWSPDGRRIAFATAMHDERDLDSAQHLFTIAAEGGAPELVLGGRWVAAAPLWTGDGATLIFAGAKSATDMQASLFRVALEGGEPRPLLAGFDRTVMVGATAYPGGRPSLTQNGAALLFCARIGGCTHVLRCDLEGAGAPRPLIDGPQQVVQGLSTAAHANRAAVVIATPDLPGDVAVLDTETAATTRVTDLNRELLDEVRLARPELRTFVAPDGVEFEAWMWGADPGERKPLLLNIHGGPHNAWTPALSSFELHQQELVAEGWCVVAPNPRGSDGYGETFMREVYAGWGINDERDFIAVVDALVADGTADPARLAVTGYSYGGCMTAWLVGHTDRFHAAVAGGVVTNLASEYGTSDGGGTMADSEFGVDPHEDPERYRRMSPLSSVTAIHTPLLILHGQADDRCDLGQAEELFTALRRLRREVELVVYPGASHTFVITGRPSQQVDYQRRLLEWVRRHVPRSDERAGSASARAVERQTVTPTGA